MADRPLLIYLVGYGPILCASPSTRTSRRLRGAAMVWDKTEKTGRVMG